MTVTSRSLARSKVGGATAVTIAMKIEVGVTHVMHKDVTLSRRMCATPVSPRVSELRPPYQSTTVKPTPTFGWKTTDWHVTPAELGTTCSSSRISHYISRTRLEHLSRGKIDSWSQLHDTFGGNFQGMYA
jgi:hypothetical protein